MSGGGYEPIDHTADLALRIWGADAPGLFTAAARGMLALCVRAPDDRVGAERELHIEGADYEDLLVDWLREILYRFNVDRVVSVPVRVDELTPTSLRAVVRETPLDADRDELLHEVKAVTYHGLAVRRKRGRWEAEVVFDV